MVPGLLGEYKRPQNRASVSGVVYQDLRGKSTFRLALSYGQRAEKMSLAETTGNTEKKTFSNQIETFPASAGPGNVHFS